MIVYCVVLSVDLVYHLTPNRRGRWVWITPQSVLATALWRASSLAFKLYVTTFGDYTAAYGAIGGAIVAMPVHRESAGSGRGRRRCGEAPSNLAKAYRGPTTRSPRASACLGSFVRLE